MLPLFSKVCVSDKITTLFKQKILAYMAKTKKDKKGNHGNSINKVQKGEILMIP